MAEKSATDYIEKISSQYGGEILLHAPYEGNAWEVVPQEICAILRITNGISETMLLPGTHGRAAIGWILYPYEMILEWTSFYAANDGVEGTVFSDDDGDCVYCLKSDGTVTCFNSMDNVEVKMADTLWGFFNGDLLSPGRS